MLANTYVWKINNRKRYFRQLLAELLLQSAILIAEGKGKALREMITAAHLLRI